MTSLTDSVLLVEVLRGLLEAQRLKDRELALQILSERLASSGPPASTAHLWAVSRLANVVEPLALNAFFPGVLDRLEREQLHPEPMALAAEILLEQRHNHAGMLRRLGKICNASPAIFPTILHPLWSALRPAAAAQRVTDADQLVATVEGTIAALGLDPRSGIPHALCHALLRRILVWPVFATDDDGPRAGASLPIGVLLVPNGLGKVWIRIAEPDGTATLLPARRDPSSVGGLGRALLIAWEAALDTWRAKHGRVGAAIRDEIPQTYSLIADLAPLERALALLRTESALGFLADPVGSVRDLLLQGQMRSLEGYLAIAILARLVGKSVGARVMVTGALIPPQKGLQWRIGWPEGADEEILVQGLCAKAVHAARTSAYGRFIVPRSDGNHAQQILSALKAHPTGAPIDVVAADGIGRLADLCLVGPWRFPRFFRCTSLRGLLAEDADVEGHRNGGGKAGEDRAAQDAFAAALRQALSESLQGDVRGLWIRVHDEEWGVRQVLRYFVELNRSFLQMSGEPYGDTQVPPQIAWCAFKGVEYEWGLRFLASLQLATSGFVDGQLLSQAEDAESVTETATEVASWLDHPYHARERWQCADVVVLFGLASLRQVCERNAGLVSTPLDGWAVLGELPGQLRGHSDERHGRHLGAVRLIVVETSDLPEPWVGSWSVEDLSHITAPSVVRSLPELPPEVLALSLLRGPTPESVAMAAIATFLGEQEPRSRCLLPHARDELVTLVDGQVDLPSDVKVAASRRSIEPASALAVHVAVACSLAPWLGLTQQLGEISTGLCCLPLSSEQWLLPHRLAEAEFHVREGLRLARKMSQSRPHPLIQQLRAAALEIVRLSYRANRHRLLSVLEQDPGAMATLKEVEDAGFWSQPLEKRDVNLLGAVARCCLHRLRYLDITCTGADASERGLMVKHVSQVGDAIRAVAATSSGREWCEMLAAAVEVELECHATDCHGSLQHIETLCAPVVAAIGARAPATSVPGPWTNALEMVGDHLLVRGKHEAARTHYRAGAKHAPEDFRCGAKLATLGESQDWDDDKKARALSHIKKHTSHVPHLRKRVAEALGLPPVARNRWHRAR